MLSRIEIDNPEQARILVGLLSSVERDGAQSQRRLASELDVALGLVNAYLKRCVRKGLVKVKSAPARRYAYYLTPRGFAEKSRLTVEYLTHSFLFFRRAKEDCLEILEKARARGWRRLLVLGASDLTEIAALAAIEAGIEIIGVVDAGISVQRFVNFPVFAEIADAPADFDGVLVADLVNTYPTVTGAVDRLGAERVLVPRLLGISKPERV